MTSLYFVAHVKDILSAKPTTSACEIVLKFCRNAEDFLPLFYRNQ
jgi:hypothetical protein